MTLRRRRDGIRVVAVSGTFTEDAAAVKSFAYEVISGALGYTSRDRTSGGEGMAEGASCCPTFEVAGQPSDKVRLCGEAFNYR